MGGSEGCVGGGGVRLFLSLSSISRLYWLRLGTARVRASRGRSSCCESMLHVVHSHRGHSAVSTSWHGGSADCGSPRLFRRVQGPQGPDDPALRTGAVQAYIQTEIARSNTPTKKYDVIITICSDRRSEGQLRSLRSKIQVFSTRSGPTHCFFAIRSTAATTGPGMATGNALRREQAAIRRSDRRTHLGDV
eukprot:scaffold27535_cov116-Isochrysis_galbana.AAC.4